MALARLDVPGLALYNGTIYPGVYKGRERRPSSACTRRSARIGPARSASTSCTRSRTPPAPGAGACGGQYTANTMSMVLEFIGLSPAGLNGIPAEDPEKDEAAHRTGELVMDLVRRDIRPSSIVTRQSLENGDRVGRRDRRLDERRPAPARRSPTNSGSPSTSTSSASVADRTPIVADMKPGGRFSASEMYDAGGVALVMRELLKKGLLHGDEATVDGRTIAEIAAAAVETPGPGGRGPDRPAAQADRRPGHPPRLPRAGRLRREARRPRAAAASRPGPRLRLGDGLLRGRPSPSGSSPATSS